MTSVEALQSGDVTTVSVGVLIALLVIGLLLVAAITKLIVRIVAALVIIGLGLLVWQQRTIVQERIHNCHFSTAFLGLKVQPSDNATAYCKKITGG